MLLETSLQLNAGENLNILRVLHQKQNYFHCYARKYSFLHGYIQENVTKGIKTLPQPFLHF